MRCASSRTLRLCVRRVLGDGWLEASGAPDRQKLENKRVTESKRRDGAVTTDDLLEYAETFHLTGLVLKNWDQFKPVFKDRKRTEVYFGLVEDVRNSIAHSRTLMVFERDLLSRIAGQIRAQVSRFRSEGGQSTLYYPLIEGVRDSLGNSGVDTAGVGYQKPLARFDVGEVVTFNASAFAADGNEVIWMMQKTSPSVHVSTQQWEVARGDSIEFSYRFTESDIKEHIFVGIAITTSSKYHRNGSVDDITYFHYQVNPPRPSTSFDADTQPQLPSEVRRSRNLFRRASSSFEIVKTQVMSQLISV